MRWWDHPRVCGEKDKAAEKAQHLRGSPPRVRGKDTLGQIVHTGVGITPACAGKSLWSPLLLILAEDHPRVCGEKHPSTAIRQRNTGSPPRVRGKVRVQAPVQEHRGITPRLCGEKNDWQRIKEAYTGSPPRMRGKDHFDVKGQFRCGITPAYAGKRHNDRNGQVTEKDHPRVCGEKSRSGLNLPRSWGSPPRMRGKVKTPQKGLQGPRITPADAGKRPLASLTTSRAKDHPRVCGEKYNYGMANKQAGGSPPRMRGKGGRWPEP